MHCFNEKKNGIAAFLAKDTHKVLCPKPQKKKKKTQKNHNKYWNMFKYMKQWHQWKRWRISSSKARTSATFAKPVDLQRLVEVDKCRRTDPKPHSGLDQPWYVCAWPLCTYLWHFKYLPQCPLRKRQRRYIQTMSTSWMNEWLYGSMPCTALVLNEWK